MSVTVFASSRRRVDNADASLTSSPTFSSVTVTSSPVSATDATNKAYVDNFMQGMVWKEGTDYKTVAPLPAYTKSGVQPGVTYTANANGVLIIDSMNPKAGDRILLDQTITDPVDCGIFTVSDPGSASTPWVMTRALDAYTLIQGTATALPPGSSAGGSAYVLTNETVLVGTDAQNWVKLTESGTSDNIANSLVRRGALGEFSAGVITVGGFIMPTAGADNKILTYDGATGYGQWKDTVNAQSITSTGLITQKSVLWANNQTANKIIALFDNDVNKLLQNSTNFFGFGVNAGSLRYQVSAISETHRFYGGATDIFDVNGNGMALNVGGFYLPTPGGIKSPLDYYEEYGWITSFIGAYGYTNVGFCIVRVGKTISMTQTSQPAYGIAGATGIFNSLSALPPRFCPSVSITFPACVVVGSNTSEIGVFSINSIGKNASKEKKSSLRGNKSCEPSK